LQHCKNTAPFLFTYTTTLFRPGVPYNITWAYDNFDNTTLIDISFNSSVKCSQVPVTNGYCTVQILQAFSVTDHYDVVATVSVIGNLFPLSSPFPVQGSSIAVGSRKYFY